MNSLKERASGLLVKLKNHSSDSLYRNAYFLILYSMIGAGSGFFFWIVASRFYDPSEIGFASVIISLINLISVFSLMGFDISLVRLLPGSNKKGPLIRLCLSASFLISIVLAVLLLIGAFFFNQSLSILFDDYYTTVLFIALASTLPLATLQSQGIFLGIGKTHYSFYQSLVTFTRIGIIPLLMAYGAFGILFSYGLSPVLSVILGLFLLRKEVFHKDERLTREELRTIVHNSFWNYLARISENLPNFLFPFIIISYVGPDQCAYFFIAWQMSSLLLSIPTFMSMSLLAEGSKKNEGLERGLRRAAKFIFILLTSAIVITWVFGKQILDIFGKIYVDNSYDVLIILVIASIPFSVNALYAAINRIDHRIRPVIIIYGGIAIISMASSLFLIGSTGMLGVGIGWCLGNSVVAVGVLAKWSIEHRLGSGH